ncbi:MAG: COX15/CtaA family protein [Acidobacteria bacterium]|nr:COX15/CtaA family protein [Acidobacteriota bacterium]
MNERSTDGAWLVPLGFATAVSMWALAYLGRLPVIMAPSWLIGLAMLLIVGGWGWRTGTWIDGALLAGAKVGLVAAIINMLILGSFLSSSERPGLVPSALWWVPGSLVITAVIAALAAHLGARGGQREPPVWAGLLSKVALGATFLLVVAGGLVTSNEAGLAVVDWPNSYGYNMFLYPISRMTGGIYYEHAHRLFGSLVGLTTVALALYLWRFDTRRWVTRLALSSVVVVIVQGILGGLRVTGNFTLSTSAEDMAPSLALAVLHGVLGQIFMGMIVALAVVTSRTWQSGSPETDERPTGDLDRTLQGFLVAVLVVQLILGAVQRHFAWGLVVHITMAAVVWMLASVAGARGWWLWPDYSPVSRLGKAVLIIAGIQVLLGIMALAVTAGEAIVGNPGLFEVMATTAHQACGALLLATSVALAMMTRQD